MSSADEPAERIAHVNATGTHSDDSSQWRDLVGWLALVAFGLALTAWAVHSGARLGTASAPFLGRYRLQISPLSVLAPGVAAGILALGRVGWFARAGWARVATLSYLAALAWGIGLALSGGPGGLTGPLADPEHYRSDLAVVGDSPGWYLRHFVTNSEAHSAAARGHPPGPVLVLWALHRLGLRSDLGVALLIAAVGALTVPLVLGAVREVCGEVPARRLAPVLILAPSAVWAATSMDVLVATLGAGMVAAGVRASSRRRTGWRAGGWAVFSGVLLGLASLFSYAAPWLGLSVVCLYFARRRPFLNAGTGLGALIPVLVGSALGFGWLAGLRAAEADYSSRVEPYRPVVWWSVLSLVVLLLALGPAGYASARKLRNTPGWPFLVGAGCAVAFTVLAGLARGGVEHAWLAFFPWLTIAAVAPARQAGPPVPAPLLLSAAGALTAIVLAAVL
jgi:methylthioxylose transferase